MGNAWLSARARLEPIESAVAVDSIFPQTICTFMPAAAAELSTVSAWFQAKYGSPTLAQRRLAAIANGANVLIASPTGTGKTFARLLQRARCAGLGSRRSQLSETIHCIYVSPLRALSYDLEKNLQQPLREIFGEAKQSIRVELRSGDTTQGQRARQFTKPPHILLTTPESLCVLLSQEKWLAHLAAVRWLIVDEIHALADNKRGAHLSISVERLDDLRRHNRPRIQRIGLSATIAPLPEVAQFLVGTNGHCEIVDVASAKKIDLRVYTPLRKNPYPEAGYTGERLIRELGALIQRHRTTLIFSNVRSGAEATTYWLRENFPEIADQIECHHASLERDVRRDVEDRLKRGELRAVVCSTSLELGIDIGAVELVVMLSTPKGREQSAPARWPRGAQCSFHKPRRAHGDKCERSRGSLRHGVARPHPPPRTRPRAGISARCAGAAPRLHGVH
jgi:ATP-dependent Lhr-like helicase